MNPGNKLPTSEHFELVRIADGVFAAIVTPGGAAFSNAGIIDLGDQTLIFDTFETPKAALDLKEAAESLTGREASFVIISHVHLDHWLGNQVFAQGTPIVTTHTIREQLPGFAGHIREMQDDPSELKGIIREHVQRLEAEPDEQKRALLKTSIARFQHSLDALPGLRLRFPSVTFDNELVFYGTERVAQLLTKGRGHTSSDCYLELAEDRIAFLGDLAFFDCQPFTPYGDPEAWTAQLDALERSEIVTFVPGHGPVGDRTNIALQKQYIAFIEESVAQFVADGRPVEDILAMSLPQPFDEWASAGSARFDANVRATYDRLSGDQDHQAGTDSNGPSDSVPGPS